MLLALSKLTSARNLNLLEEILLDYSSVLEIRGLSVSDIVLTMFKVWHMRAKALTWDDPKLEKKVYGQMVAEMKRFVEEREESWLSDVINDNAAHKASPYDRGLYRESEQRMLDLTRKLENQGHSAIDVINALGNVMMMRARDSRDPEVLRHFRAVTRIFQTYLDDVAKIYRRARHQKRTTIRTQADDILRHMIRKFPKAKTTTKQDNPDLTDEASRS